jgi:hypothetical protein
MKPTGDGSTRKAGPTWKMNAAGTREVKFNAAGNPVGYKNMKTGPAGNKYPGPMRHFKTQAQAGRSGGVGRRSR